MSARKRMSLGGLRGRASPTASESGLGESENKSVRRSSIGLRWAAGIGGALKTSVQRASAAADRFERRLFAEYDDDPVDFSGDGDVYGMLCAQRGQGQRAEFESRYRHLVETLGDLSLTADVDPDGAAAQLNASRATEDLDAMLSLLRAEERQNSRAEHSRGSSRIDGAGNVAGDGGGGGDLLAAPCLEFLLEERVVKLLCEMGSADRPAGTMALMLGAVASLLGQVAHPLLPSKEVHDPISKLVTAAGTRVRRLDGAGGGAPAGVQASLARLLGEMWRKLREESALLDFFLRADEGGDLRLDVFDRLLPLLELRGRAGQQAQEACLVALSVKDARVGRYVRDRTGLASKLAETLTARYMALYDTLEELQVAAALPPPAGAEKDETGAAGGIAGLLTQQQPERAEATFTEALTLFLQHLRFCNAVGLVAADTQACLRPPSALMASSPGGGASVGAATVVHTVTRSGDASSAAEAEDGLATKLATKVRTLLLSNAVGPALTSALESRARWTTTIVARTLTELSAGVEGYGVAVAGLAASAGEGGGGRRQLGPLVETVSAFLVGREGSGNGGATAGSSSPVSSLPTSPVKRGALPFASAAPASTSASMVLMTSRRSNNVCLRDVLLRRLDSSSPPQLRVSTLELLASLAELRDDRVLLDLVLCPDLERLPSEGNAAGGERGTRREQPESGRGGGGGGAKDGLEALLDASPGGALEGLRVSRSMIDSFGSAFGGSPIHPSFRLFSASSHLSLEGYLVAAHQRQIHQLMEGARGGGQAGEDVDAEMLDMVVGSDGGKVLQAVAAVAAAGAEIEGEGVAAPAPAAVAAQAPAASSSSSSLSGAGGGEVDDFDAAGFAREHGNKLAVASVGSFLHALFDCLEAVFERTLEENLAVTGVLSSLCLAATAAEVSPVRRLLLVLLFDGTQDAPFRSMRRILEKLWASAKERVASLPDASRQLARARASLGMPPVGDPADLEDVKGVPGDGSGAAPRSGRQGSRGMREELSNSKRRQQQQQQQSSSGSNAEDGAVGGPAGARGGDTLSSERRSASPEQLQHEGSSSSVSSSSSPSHFLATYVFLEEFLKELFCALSAKNGVETDAQGLSESHRKGSAELLRTRLLSVDGDGSPRQASGPGLGGKGGGDRGFGAAEGAAGDEREKEEEEEGELPTSLDEFLREAAFPTFVSPPLSY